MINKKTSHHTTNKSFVLRISNGTCKYSRVYQLRVYGINRDLCEVAWRFPLSFETLQLPDMKNKELAE
jgi:hypothetical protein